MYHWSRTEHRTLVACILAAVLVVGAGCASGPGKQAEKAAVHQNWDAAVFYYLEALANDPDNLEYRNSLTRARQKAGQEHFRRGTALRQLGRLAVARDELQMAVQLDPTHQFAEQVLREVEADLKVLMQPDGDRTLDELKRQAREAKVKPPVLDPSSKEPITLNFPQPKPVKEIYSALGKASGFNVTFDPKLKDDRLSIELSQVSAERALEIVMQAAGHFYKVLDPKTIVVADDTPQNRRDYEDLVIKTFFLSNGDVKEVDKLLRSLIEARRLSTNEQLNAITLRDTADKVAIAEKLITTNDKAKAEVLVDVELLEVNTTNQSNLGMTLSTYAFTLSADLDMVNPDRPGGGLFLDDLKNISRENLFINVPSVLINLIKSSSRATALAQPQMRITEGEKGTVHIGQREPIPVTSFNTAYQGQAGAVTPITSFQYQDIGIKIDVEPRVHHNREVTLKLTVEVSAIAGERSFNTADNAQRLPIIGTRNITTVIRLRDGETNMLVGLFKEDASESTTETPGLSAIPVIGRLFTNKDKRRATTDLVLTLTPHILRFPDITEEDLAPVWVGTESRISYFGGASPRVHSGSAPQGPVDAGGAGEEAKAAGEEEIPTDTPYRIRRSSVRAPTPRQIEPPTPQPSGGIELVPGQGSKSLDLGGPAETPFDPDLPPVLLNLEPAVVSLQPEQGAYLQLVARGGAASYRLPLTLSFDPSKVAIVGLEFADSVVVMDEGLDAEAGVLVLDLAVIRGGELPSVLAAVEFVAREPGPAPLVFSTAGAFTSGGARIPVATGDGAVFVTIPPGAQGSRWAP